MQVFILLFILYFLPLYDCYLNNFYYTKKNNFIALKSSLNNNNKSSNKKMYDDYSNFLNYNKKMYDDYSNFLNYNKKITYIDLNNISKNNTNSIKKELLNTNVVILYNSNTKTILRNIKDILKY